MFYNANEERKVNKFPRPFKINCTPYKQVDFSDVTKKVYVDQSVLSTLKISKVIILGDVSVGKTCIVNRFCRHIFDSNYKSTIGVDFEVERFDILNVFFNLQIWDTAGQERFKCIAQSYYRAAHVVAVVFDLTDIWSLSHCKTWLQEALLSSSSTEPFVFLIGTKKDLMSPAAYKSVEASGMKMAISLSAEYWAVSSKTGENIKELFFRIAALCFDSTIVKESIKPISCTHIGSDLVSFKKNSSKSRKRSKCNEASCQK